MELLTREYNTVSGVQGPLLIVEDVRELAYGSIVRIIMPDGSFRTGQAIEITEKHAVIQVFEETIGLDVAKTKIRFLEDCARVSLSGDMLGRVFSWKRNSTRRFTGYSTGRKASDYWFRYKSSCKGKTGGFYSDRNFDD